MKDKKLVIVLLILVLILLAGGAYWLGKSNNKESEKGVNIEENNGQQVKNNVSDCLPTTAPWIKVISPNGGEIYKMGDTINLTWKSCNLSKETPITGELVDVINPNGGNSNSRSLFCEGSDNPDDLKGIDCQNNGNRLIKLSSNIVPGNYRIKISSGLISPFINDSSDNLFTINSSSEESSTEVFNNQPGAIKSIKENGTNKWLLSVDLLSYNSKWLPGVDSTGGPYINQNTKLRNLSVTSTTKAYDCGFQYANGTNIGPKLQNISSYVTNIKSEIAQTKIDIKNRIGGPVESMTDWALYSFDIIGTNITAIYEQCLP